MTETAAKKRVRRLRPLTPERLTPEASQLWPDLTTVPTNSWIKDFNKRTRRDPEVRLSVLNGLRRFAESSSGIMLGLATFFVALLAVLLALSPDGPYIWILRAAVGAAAFLTLAFVVNAAANLEERRKSAIVWLKAIEDNA
jgi:hypothetical protein